MVPSEVNDDMVAISIKTMRLGHVISTVSALTAQNSLLNRYSMLIPKFGQ